MSVFGISSSYVCLPSVNLRYCTSSTRRSEKKESAATAARLKGNRFYKAKRWEQALELYMTSLKAKPYAVNTLANVAQVGNRFDW